jgi:hypothetical protein
MIFIFFAFFYPSFVSLQKLVYDFYSSLQKYTYSKSKIQLLAYITLDNWKLDYLMLYNFLKKMGNVIPFDI